MQRQEQYSVYRTPFKCKFMIGSKPTPSKSSNNHFQSMKDIQNSPYSIKYSDRFRSTKPPQTPPKIEEALSGRQTPTVEIRLKSAPHKPSRQNNFAQQYTDSDNFFINNQIKTKIKTSRDPSARSTSKKKLSVENETRLSSYSQSQRKFTVTVVNILQKNERSRRSVDRKLEKYDYKTVLGDALPFRSKKLPRIMISEQGVARLQKN